MQHAPQNVSQEAIDRAHKGWSAFTIGMTWSAVACAVLVAIVVAILVY